MNSRPAFLSVTFCLLVFLAPHLFGLADILDITDNGTFIVKDLIMRA